jgi:hypothetical protein
MEKGDLESLRSAVGLKKEKFQKKEAGHGAEPFFED